MAPRKRKNPAAVALGRLGGAVTSEAKAAAARMNGQNGGRPSSPTSIRSRRRARQLQELTEDYPGQRITGPEPRRKQRT